MSGAVKGWCPGALRPMASGDGLIARLRISCGEVPLALARDIADWAETYGNGALDLSSRANLQIRGVSEASLPALTQRLAEAGLTDASPEAEAVRNVLVSPFAGLVPPCDVRPHARAWERELGVDRDLWALPTKFGAAFDAGAYPLGVEADLLFTAVSSDTFILRLGGMAEIGPFPCAELVGSAKAAARAFLALRETATPPKRLRDAIAVHGLAPFSAQPLLTLSLSPQAGRGNRQVAPRDWLGAHILEEGAIVGVALPFGRIEAGDLRALATLAAEVGAAELRLTPWRALLIPCPPSAAQKLAEGARNLGLILDPADPLLAVAACPGAPACSSASADTRAAARRLAPLMAPGAFLHVSGCEKGCAHPGPAAHTVVAAKDGYKLIRGGRADAKPLAQGLTLAQIALRLRETA